MSTEKNVMGTIVWVSLLFLVITVHANVQSKVKCSDHMMEVEIIGITLQNLIYLQQLKNYPDEACKPKFSNGIATFKLSLMEKDMSHCGIMRITNKLTGQKVYYHRIIVEKPSNSSKITFIAKCSITDVVVQKLKLITRTNHTVVAKRSVLPEDFVADANTPVLGMLEGNASEPKLLFNVRQGNKIIKDELVVKPGTPLQMEIYLSEEAAKVYGLLVTHMQVTDTKSQEETIIYNGCSVDPYLFENFETVNGHFLSAKFRAFKFPESSYVQFHGTVTVCVGKCRGFECSNGKIGYGRRRRTIESSNKSKNEVWEMAMSVFLRVDFDHTLLFNEEVSKFIRKGKTRERTVRAEEIGKQFKYNTNSVKASSSTISQIIGFFLMLLYFC
ncbi:PREDICTED: uncharacterized protein LOC105366654 [Ceratosolen solmsi marchali]|uniref:Uncharacterized protein LOC105366654 n=1 Tax=Ceratosolen solmsi marchali TaxID=326594 RepID=A0AAJ6YSN1_9HYME|nr:PREDICTED: uncharacterized protein LOC105366654 [Ceratosolen solmsi marchali]XP_011503470.1 PREDICTED: uncharacterized protein LOC105366654 [Ceratosolen solmsi marchali]